MLTPGRSLVLNSESGRELPRVPGLEALYRVGARPRHGEVVMVLGRSGSQKSGFALWWTASMNLPTLYLSADMSAFTASSRLACMATGDNTETVERRMAAGDKGHYLDALKASRITFGFGSPITWRAVDEELEAYVELWDSYPEVIVLDNLCDFEGAESDYVAQMEVMASCTEMARETGATVIIMHHATDKGWNAIQDPWSPPSRDQAKNGLSEKPELSLSVALDPTSYEFKIAVIKQRSGRSDPTARTFARLRCYPEITRFGVWQGAVPDPTPPSPVGLTPIILPNRVSVTEGEK